LKKTEKRAINPSENTIGMPHRRSLGCIIFIIIAKKQAEEK
jgi:hypothetical protein